MGGRRKKGKLIPFFYTRRSAIFLTQTSGIFSFYVFCDAIPGLDMRVHFVPPDAGVQENHFYAISVVLTGNRTWSGFNILFDSDIHYASENHLSWTE
jgi:hypothetical protein